MNPDHLLEHADYLIEVGPPGRPRQANLKRVVSSAYYALFHFTMRAAADMVLGKTAPKDALYARAYRSLTHEDLRKRLAVTRAIGADIKAFADAIVELQEARHNADYDPLFRVNKSEAIAKVRTARAAIAKFESASEAEQKSCLVTLLFKGR
jgi:uncharacterized protein (UPF0332 family)